MARRFFEAGGAESGKIHEIDMIGKEDAGRWVYLKRGENPKVKEPLEQSIRKLLEFWPEKIKYFRRGKQVESDLRINPEKATFKDIYNQVSVALLGEEGAEDEEVLRKRLFFFNTLNSPPDHFYGTDGVFVYIDDQGEKHFCTIDVTKNPSKEEGYKADIIIFGEPPDPKQNFESYQRWVNEHSVEIAFKLKHGSTLH